MDPVGRMDLQNVEALACALVDIDSTTGREGDLGDWLAPLLRRCGYHVFEQPVVDRRRNLFVQLEAPAVVLSTHLDCVPPFFPSRREGRAIVGRGACDAKGALAAQLVAVEQLRREGCSRVGLLFVVGEERGSDGARAAQQLTPGSRHLVNGEPTDNRLGLATRGVLRVRLVAAGRAAHSSYPELGESAIEKLVSALVALRGLALPDDPAMGRTHYTVGVISGGVAANVIPASATAEIVFRTVGDLSDLRRTIATLEPLVHIEELLEVPPVKMAGLPGFETAAFPFTTDIPFLANWGEPHLFGPGSATVAHTADERIEIDDLHRAVDGYVRLARQLLQAD
jgi:acetylornithine deacetylase